MKNYFNFTDFLIDPYYGVPLRVMNAIYKHHLFPINRVRNEIKIPIKVSKNSCYRPKEYELDKGRNGKSQHTFHQEHKLGIGAADYSASDLNLLLDGLIKHTNYTRICIYPNSKFIHCDYARNTGQRQYFIDYSDGNGWNSLKIC